MTINNQNFTIMIEEDTAERNFTAYIPALRLGAIGDSLEEVRENARELLLMEIAALKSKGRNMPIDNCILETITIPVMV